MNLLCYSTQSPEKLTSTQKVTRLYRAQLRDIYATNLRGVRPDFVLFNESITSTRREFQKLLDMPVDSIEFNSKLEKYEKILENNFDPSMVIEECRPYSGSAGRYLVFANESLEFDPFGYYKPRLLAGRVASENFPYFEDYPMHDSHWDLWETFGRDFDDAPEIHQ